MKYRDLFETTECNRCGGCGRHSWNQRDGDRCWGCNGSGLAYTKAGAAAFAEYRERTVIELAAREVEVGWVVTMGGHGTVERFFTVASVERDGHTYGDGSEGVRVSAANGTGFVTQADWKVRRRLNAEQRRDVYESMHGVPGVTGIPWVTS